MANDVKVIIDISKPLGKIGFGIPLIFTLEAAEGTAKAYKECKTLEDVVTAGFTADSDTYKAAQLIFMQDKAPATIAVCSGTGEILAELGKIIDKSWRQLIVIGETIDFKVVSDYIETKNNKMYFASVDSLDEIKALTKPERTVVFYYKDASVICPVAALVGATAGLAAGSFTYKNMILKGIAPLALADVEIAEATAANVISFVTKAGDNVTTEGKVLSGEYVDVIDSEDYVISQLEYQTQKLLNNSLKIPYDNNGIAMLEAVAVNVLKDAFNNGIIGLTESEAPNYSVNYALREETDPADRVARKYLGGKFSFGLAGAIHEVEIRGEIII